MSELYDVLFTGKVESAFSEDQVKSNFRQYLKLSDSQIKKMFAGGNVYIKKNISKDRCEAYILKLKNIGASCYIVPASVRTEALVQALPQTVNQSNNSVTPPMALVEQPVRPTRDMSRQVIENVRVKDVPAEVVYVQYESSPTRVGRLLEGVFWIFIGFFAVLAFSPFPDGAVRRGFAIGLLLMLYGMYKLFIRRKALRMSH